MRRSARGRVRLDTRRSSVTRSICCWSMCFSLNSEGGLLGRAAEQSSTRSLVPWLFLRDHNISQRAPRATCARPYRNSYRAALLRDSAGWSGESLPAPPAKCQVGQDRQHHRNPGQAFGMPVSLERVGRADVHVLARSVTRTRRAHVTCLRYVECSTNLVQWCTHLEHRVEKNANWAAPPDRRLSSEGDLRSKMKKAFLTAEGPVGRRGWRPSSSREGRSRCIGRTRR